jgi:tetratricopeptide (TPR) repeat protein
MAKTRGKGIRQRAISELENLSLSLDEELEITANVTIAEIDDELRELDVDPYGLPSVSLDHMLSEKAQSMSPAYVHLLDDLLDDEIATDEVKTLILELRELSKQRRYEEALELARRATHLAPDYWRAWDSYGSLVVLLGNLDEGEVIFRRMRKDFSGNPKAVGAALHGYAYARMQRRRNYSDEDLLAMSRLIKGVLESDNPRPTTRARLVNFLLSLRPI